MSQSRYIVGVDIGGTSTKGVLLSLSGKVEDSVITTGLNYQLVPREYVVHTVLYVLEFLSRSGQEIQGVGVGVAGLYRDEEREELLQALREQLPDIPRIVVTSDLETAAYAALLGRPGIVVVGGTGMIAYGQDPLDHKVRRGGYGFLLGDEGSGFWLGLQGLMAAIKAFEGRGPATALVEKILEKTGMESFVEAIPYFYADPQKRIADLAPLVLDAAIAQDTVAERIVEEGTQEVARLVESVYRELQFPETFPVKLAGGIFQNNYYFHRTRQAIQKTFPGARVEHSVATPAYGAALIVMKDLLHVL